jgi:hypothetical protein
VNVLLGLLLIAHGLVHLAVWLAPPADGAPFDPGRSWLIGDARGPARRLAGAACVLFVVAGLLVSLGLSGGPGVAAAGAVVSLVLVALTFNRWLSGAVAINVAIALLALA